MCLYIARHDPAPENGLECPNGTDTAHAVIVDVEATGWVLSLS